MISFSDSVEMFCQANGINYTRAKSRITILHQNKTIKLYGALSNLDSPNGCNICNDKIKSEAFLKKNSIPTTESKKLYTPPDAINFYEQAKEKTVIKPKNGSRSRAVTVSINSSHEAVIAYYKCQALGGAIGQTFLQGRNYRVTVLNDSIMFALERIGEAGLPVSVSTGATREELEFDESWPIMQCCLSLTRKLRMHTVGFDVIAPSLDSSEFWILEMNQGPILFPFRAPKFVESFLE